MKKNIKFLSIISLLSLGLVLPFLGNTFSSKEEVPSDTPKLISEKYEKGPVFYPASYNTSFSDEPRYNSYQKSLTYDYMNMGNVSSNYRGDSVKVAVIDSGIKYDHEDFKLNNVSVVKGQSRSIEYTTVDKTTGWYYFNFSNSPTHLADSHGHGTNVASVIASVLNGVGDAGIAPNVELYIYKVTNANNGYEWTAINNALQYCIDEKMDVINMSFQAYVNTVTYGSTSQAGGGNAVKTVLRDKINACHNAGITMVAAAGNFNTTESSYPAQNNHVISVGSLARKSSNTKAGFSNYGEGKIDLVAPGYVDVASRSSTSSYVETQGTSFSAPLVAGAIALYKQKFPDATPDEIKAALLSSCDEIPGESSWAGAGRLNVANFLQAEVYSETGVSLDKSSTSIDLGTTTKTVQLTATVENGEFFPDVSWSSSNTSVATVSSSGLVTGKAVGSTTISATTTHGYTATCTITVSETQILPTSITLNCSDDIKLAVGDIYPLSWTVNPSNTTNKNVTFIREDDPEGCISIDSDGVITAIKEGYSLLQIRSVADNSVMSSDIEITISNSASSSIAPRNGTYSLLTNISNLKAGQRIIFSSGTSNAKGMVQTQSNNNRSATGITFSNSKIIVGDSSNSSLATFIVESGTKTDSFAFKDDGTSKGYLYAASSSNNYLRTQSNKDDNSSFVISLLNTGSATVTAQGTYSNRIIRYNSGSNIFSCYGSGQSPVYIYYQDAPIYPSTTVVSGNSTANTGETVPLSISYQPGTTTVKETTWTSSDNTIAIVNSSGVVSALKAGTVTITATSKSGESSTITSTHIITISDVSVTSVTLNEHTLALIDGNSVTLTATVLPINATNKNVTWESSNTNVATVTNGVVTGVGVGDTTITVTTLDGELTDYCLITVSERPALESIEVTGYTSTVPYMDDYDAGDYTCTAHYVNGTTSEVVPEITLSVNTSILGEQDLVFSYTDNGITKTYTGKVKVTNVGAQDNVGESTGPQEEKQTVTSTFIDKDWGTSNNSWTNNKSGGGFDSSRGIQVMEANSGAGATTKSSFTNVSKITVVWSTSSGGAGSFAVKVGSGTAKSKTVSKSQTNQTESFTFSPYESGVVNITVTCSKSSIYIKSVSIETTTITPGQTYPATPEDQAIAYATYFRSITGPYCQATDGGAMQGDVWNDLKTEYNEMVNDAKDMFCSGSSNETVIDARARYRILVTAYSNLENFIVDSNKTPLVNRLYYPSIINISNNCWIIVVIILVSFISFSSFLILRKKRD